MINSFAFLVLWVMVMATPLEAQCKLAFEAKHSELVDNAQELAVQGDWKGARDFVKKTLAECRPGPEGSSCRKLNNFNFGYLAQEEALSCNLQTGERIKLLQQALTFYRNSLAEPPPDGATLNNLAGVEAELGNTNDAIQAWNHAIEVDPDAAWQYALRLGDVFREQERLEDARHEYSRSASLAPDQPGPPERYVDTYRHAPISELKDLLHTLPETEGLFPQVARTGYELIISRDYKEQPGNADQALMRWTIVTSREGWLSKDSFDALPQDWDAPSVTELRTYFQNPATTSPPWHWWLLTDDRRHVMIDVALVAGRELVNDQRPEDAIKCWETALKLAKDLRGNGPDMPPGESPIPSPLVLEGELQLLHFQNNKLKGGYHDFRQMYQGYSYAAMDQNLPDLQQYHTILGMIFASEKKWFLSSIPFPLEMLGMGFQRWGAIAELSAALKVADQRREKEGFYQPLPEIKASLAQGFLETKHRNDAQGMFLKAAVAYLDGDSPSDSTKMLEGYKEAGGAGSEAATLDEFIRYRSSSLVEKPSEEKEPWLYKASATLDEAFLLRQRFKVFADLAMNESLSRSERLDCALQAYNLAVKQRVSLVGAADLLRWEKVSATLLQVGNIPPGPFQPLQGSELAVMRPRETVTTFSFPGDLNPVGVGLSRELQTAAAIVATVGPADALVLKDHIVLRNQQVFFPEANVPPEVNSILRRLENSGAVRVTGPASPMASISAPGNLAIRP
jgi:tetratricopeptide (TPR) repeat protein